MTFPAAVQGVDEALLRAAQGTPHPLVLVFFGLTVVGGGWGLAFAVPFAFRRATRVAVAWLFGLELVVSGMVTLLKSAFGRVRPCDALGWCPVAMGPSPGGCSFPSGHAAGTFAFAAFVGALAPRYSPLLLLVAAAIAWSRCVLGVHYPSDVLAGAVLGSATGLLAATFYKRRAGRPGPPAAPAAPEDDGEAGTAGAP